MACLPLAGFNSPGGSPRMEPTRPMFHGGITRKV